MVTQRHVVAVDEARGWARRSHHHKYAHFTRRSRVGG